MSNKKHYLLLALSLFFIAACGTKKTDNSSNNQLQDETAMTKIYPALNGYTAHEIKVPEKEDEAQLRLEIIPGKNTTVDACNKFGLQGEFKEKELSDGETYLVFESDGEIIATQMGCPDDSKHTEFVSGITKHVPYNSAQTVVVYAPSDMEVKYRVWTAGKMYSIYKPTDDGVTDDAARVAFPKEIKGYERYVLLLPKLTDAQREAKSRIIELIPGFTREVDCNHHWITGEFTVKTAEGWGYEYYVFDSDGTVAATRMACPDEALQEKFIFGQTHNIVYNSSVPIVVFAPKGFDVKYRVWEADNE